jgi:molecular chaperone DnaK
MSESAEPIVGIDLGTTHSVVACLDRDGKPQTIKNAEGDSTTPSAVFFDRSEVIVGREAIKAARFEPWRIAMFAKRDVGRSAYRKAICGNELPPEVIQALVLQKLREDAELKLGSLEKVVVTVPAYFNEPRRKATQDAGKLAGLDVIDIINEPTAAAIAFGVERGFISSEGSTEKPETVLVYDLGGGTFDATLMRLDGVEFTALATSGDVYLGGVDWDSRLVDMLAEQFLAEHNLDPRDDPIGAETLRQEAEDAKKTLTARESAAVMFEYGGRRARLRVTRTEFEDRTGELLDRTVFTVNKVLREAKLSWDDVTRIILVGGSSRMPMIVRTLRQESGIEIDRSLSPDESVAHGAALYAGFLLQGDHQARLKLKVQNVNSHDLGVLGLVRETGKARRRVIVPRNTPLPAVGKGRFKTKKHDQRDVAIEVVEGGDDHGENATMIGKCVICDLPHGIAANTPIEIRFKYQPSGRLTVRAWVEGTKSEATLTLERQSGLTDATLLQWQQRLSEGIHFENQGDSLESDSVALPKTAREQVELSSIPTVELVEHLELGEEPIELEDGGSHIDVPSDDDLNEFLGRID